MLVSMPFGSVFWPSYALSLLAAELLQAGFDARVEYFTIAFAERIGQRFYSNIAGGEKPATYELAGEWIFAEALFGPRDDERYLEEILQKRSLVSGKEWAPRVSTAFIDRVRRARGEALDFLDRCLARVLETSPRIVGFTSVFQQHVASLALAKRIKERASDTFVVFGGANCEGVMGAETVRQFPFVDAAVSGEGDIVFPELVRRVLGGRSLDDLSGVRTPAGVAEDFSRGRFESASAVQDLDTLPYPDYRDFFGEFAKSRFHREWQPSIFFETSRGCWWGARQHCTFCGLNGSSMAYRSKSTKRALTEILSLAGSYPGCGIDLVDNILDMGYFADFLPALAEKQLGLSLFYETKANLAKEQVRMLAASGIRNIQPGIESLSDPILKRMRKGVSALQNVQLLKWCKELGVDPSWNFLWGFPGEPEDEYVRMAELVPHLAHLPAPRGTAGLRLDRFSPYFFDAEKFGLKEIAPVDSYRHVYRVPEEALANLAYFFSYRDVRDKSYVRPLLERLREWKKAQAQSDLFSVDVDGRLLIWDLRPRSPEPLTVLRGVDRALYRACDKARGLRSLTRALNASWKRHFTTGEIGDRLEPLVARRLLVALGSRYLALAIPLGEYVPSELIGRLFHKTARELGRPFGDRVGVPLPSRASERVRYHVEIRRRPDSPDTLTRECFRIVERRQRVVVSS